MIDLEGFPWIAVAESRADQVLLTILGSLRRDTAILLERLAPEPMSTAGPGRQAAGQGPEKFSACLLGLAQETFSAATVP